MSLDNDGKQAEDVKSSAQRRDELSSSRKGFDFYHNVSRPLLGGMDITRYIMSLSHDSVRLVFQRYRDMVNPKMEAHLFAMTFEQFRFLFKLASIDELNAAGMGAAGVSTFLNDGSAEAQMNILQREGDAAKTDRAAVRQKHKLLSATTRAKLSAAAGMGPVESAAADAAAKVEQEEATRRQ